MITAAATPTPIPIFAPVPRAADGEEVAEGRDAVMVAGELVAEPLELVGAAMSAVVAGREEVNVERCWVAVLAEEAMVVKGFPVPDNWNLPTPLLQQSVVWSQQ